MNEQELADLFSTQIDRLLGGEPAVALAVDGHLPLLALGQQLTEISFQPSPAAQTAFQSQLASWFGSTGGGLSTTVFGWPKILLLSLGAALMVISAGLGVVVLISLIWTGALFNPSDESRSGLGVTPQVTPGSPVAPLPALASPEATPSPTRRPTATRPQGGSSLEDVLPTPTTAVGDTILRPTATLTSTTADLEVTVTPDGNQASDGDDAGDNSTVGDHDRGHGNDLDGYDEDNPGQSDGVSGGNSQNNDDGGISPGNLSGGSAGSGGASGGGNAGGDDYSNGGNNGGGQGGGHGGGNSSR
ncbi:MAG: hypothetical protein HYR94_23680 [Chloroflexi bacterium]|nr:hypothetical protein [Chloroflexota bacterium]